MTMAPLVDDARPARPVFRGLRELRDELAQRHPEIDWRHLSMGMTNDFEVAVGRRRHYCAHRLGYIRPAGCMTIGDKG